VPLGPREQLGCALDTTEPDVRLDQVERGRDVELEVAGALEPLPDATRSGTQLRFTLVSEPCRDPYLRDRIVYLTSRPWHRVG
jgi:hypothetical protein